MGTKGGKLGKTKDERSERLILCLPVGYEVHDECVEVIADLLLLLALDLVGKQFIQCEFEVHLDFFD